MKLAQRTVPKYQTGFLARDSAMLANEATSSDRSTDLKAAEDTPSSET
jgi:hypothetical protein